MQAISDDKVLSIRSVLVVMLGEMSFVLGSRMLRIWNERVVRSAKVDDRVSPTTTENGQQQEQNHDEQYEAGQQDVCDYSHGVVSVVWFHGRGLPRRVA